MSLILLYSILTLAACQNDGNDKNTKKYHVSDYNSEEFIGAGIKFDTTSFNFGKVYEGEQVCRYFKYKNTGNKNLLILNITTSCGCTIPAYSTEPVLPGADGEIKVVFNSEGRLGYNIKTLNIETNGEPKEIELRITAEVIEK